MKLKLFRRQFILTKKDNFDLPWEKKSILDYSLFYHPELEFECIIKENNELYLLGFLFDYKNPSFSNKRILSELSNESCFDSFLENLSKYSGHYIIIYKLNKNLFLLNDSCSQYSIFYDDKFSTFGSQPILLNRVIDLKPHKSIEALKFYESPEFLKRKEFIGTTTHKENIKHLLPNHFIDLNLKTINRFFPKNPIVPISISNASILAQNMLEGYIKAASNRYNLTMGVTGGYDSRVLFLASLNVKCKYYVSKLDYMDFNHPDIIIPKKLTKLFHKNLKIISKRDEINENTSKIINISVDFPRDIKKLSKYFENHIIINGNLSEIARNAYGGNRKNISSKDLAFLYGYLNNEFVIGEYGKWLKNSMPKIIKNGYNVLDFFYWEDRMSTWVAKSKTEMNALGTIVYSPFCSRELLTILLSTPRKHRDGYNNKLYNDIIKGFSSETSKIPINPNLINRIVRLLKVLRLFNLIQELRLKFRLIRFSR